MCWEVSGWDCCFVGLLRMRRVRSQVGRQPRCKAVSMRLEWPQLKHFSNWWNRTAGSLLVWFSSTLQTKTRTDHYVSKEPCPSTTTTTITTTTLTIRLFYVSKKMRHGQNQSRDSYFTFTILKCIERQWHCLAFPSHLNNLYFFSNVWLHSGLQAFTSANVHFRLNQISMCESSEVYSETLSDVIFCTITLSLCR